MDTEKKFVTGLDLGTANSRVVILSSGKDDTWSVVGYNESRSVGMRKGVPAKLDTPAAALDKMLGDAERMGGYEVNSAFVSVNGSSVASRCTEGKIAFSSSDHEVTVADLNRLEEVALSNCPLSNRQILDVVPLEYALDGQIGIKDPLDMSGERLESRTLVVSALTQVCENLKKVTSAAAVQALRLVPSAVAAARAVLTDAQRENGVAVIDFGAATTSVAVYEEGDLQYVGVVPAGSNNITNDLAIVLAIDPCLAEKIKRDFITGDFTSEKDPIIHVGRPGKDERFFERAEVENVVRLRLGEIFEEIRKKLRAAHYDQRLPEGIILTGGGARMRDIELFAREILEASVKIGTPKGLGGVAESVEKPEFATAVGLALLATDESLTTPLPPKNASKGPKKPKNGNLLKKIFSKF